MIGFSFSELCGMLGKESVYVRNLQHHLDLHVPGKDEGYSQSYVIFMEKVVSLRAFHIPLDEIGDLFDTEKKVLSLLHVDSLTHSPTWYIDACVEGEEDDVASDRLLLCGYRLGFPFGAQAVQPTLDFGQRDPELFKGVEMGEDVRLVLAKYLNLLKEIRKRIEKERPVLETALQWAKGFLRQHVR
jgi:hypothetical protein